MATWAFYREEGKWILDCCGVCKMKIRGTFSRALTTYESSSPTTDWAGNNFLPPFALRPFNKLAVSPHCPRVDPYIKCLMRPLIDLPKLPLFLQP